MTMMVVRKALPYDLPQILPTYDYAREFMWRNGNPTQWHPGYPPLAMLENDISVGRLFVVEDSGIIYGAFMFIVGEDPTYIQIENGVWLSDNRYGVIHRVASNGRMHGIMDHIIAFCESRIPHLRIDTHEDNTVMRHILGKNGFTRCGIIYVADGTARVAYEKVGV